MSAQVSPSLFGSGWSCVDDLTMPAVMVTGNRIVAEAIARRLTTPRGGLIDDPNYGYDLTDFLNDDLSPTDVARIAAGVQAECVKDERVSSAVATVTLTAGVMVVTIALTTANGPFTLVLSITDVTVSILKVTPQ